jgi:hypothetical protein
MAHPYHHTLASVKKWGGEVSDYLPLHDWFDQSKAIAGDFRPLPWMGRAGRLDDRPDHATGEPAENAERHDRSSPQTPSPPTETKSERSAGKG